jgi:ribonuclease-3
VAETGPDHDKRFVVEVLYGGGPSARGEGRTKKAAEIAAAKDLFLRLRLTSTA